MITVKMTRDMAVAVGGDVKQFRANGVYQVDDAAFRRLMRAEAAEIHVEQAAPEAVEPVMTPEAPAETVAPKVDAPKPRAARKARLAKG